MIRRVWLAIALLTFTSVGFSQETEEENVKVEVGKEAPDFVMTGIDGEDFKLSDKLGQDKNIVLMFSRAHW